jgi:hypothetical protein
LYEWVLSEEGHGAEWWQVMRVGTENAEAVWDAISTSAMQAKASGVRDLGRFGLSCEVDSQLVIGERSATIRVIWHYAAPDAAPRLVSAFPRL